MSSNRTPKDKKNSHKLPPHDPRYPPNPNPTDQELAQLGLQRLAVWNTANPYMGNPNFANIGPIEPGTSKTAQTKVTRTETQTKEEQALANRKDQETDADRLRQVAHLNQYGVPGLVPAYYDPGYIYPAYGYPAYGYGGYGAYWGVPLLPVVAVIEEGEPQLVKRIVTEKEVTVTRKVESSSSKKTSSSSTKQDDKNKGKDSKKEEKKRK